MVKKWFGMVILAVFILLNGCGVLKGEDKKGYIEKGEYHWSEGPARVITLSSEKEFLEEKQLTVNWESEYIMTKDAVWKLIAAMNEAKERKQYYLFYSITEEKWGMLDAGAGTTKDGRNYDFLSMPFASVTGEAYAVINQEKEGKGIAGTSSKGVGEYIGSVATGFTSNNVKMTLGRDGKVYEWINSGDNVYLCDAKNNAAKLHCLDGGTEVTAEGWIIGAIQKNGAEEIQFYGMDRERKPAMWDADGNRLPASFPEELTAPEYYAVYEGNGSLLFCDRYGLWEFAGEGYRCLFSFMENGYQFDSILGMALVGETDLRILMGMDGTPAVFLYDLSKKNLRQEKKELVLAACMPNAAFNRMVADFNGRDHEYYVTVRLPEKGEDQESFQRRIQLELTAGKGPDLLEESVLFDVNSMISKGLIKCLEESEFKDLGCLPSCLETGKSGDGLYGIPYDFSLDFVAWRKEEIGVGETLTVDKMIRQMQASQREVLDASCSALEIVTKYALRDESNTDYIDWQQGKSKLSGQAFLDLLALAMEHAADDLDYEEASRIAFAMSPRSGIFTLSDFGRLTECLGDYVILGYPRNDGKGIYVWTNKIYVNDRKEAAEGAVRFLKYLISERAQVLYVSHDVTGDAERKMDENGLFVNKMALFPVNRSALEKMINEEDGNQPENQFVMDSGKVIYLKQPLSSNQVSEFWNMVDQAIPANYKISRAKGMISEELEPYFEGQITAREAAEKLDKRLQLYLDENR